jgi:transcriptional regulator with XRE-family HTH domain
MDPVGIADFLRRHREALQPGDIGMERGRRRRAAGLRREEVAALATISTDFYARMEQRRASRPSVQTVAALAQALRLTPDERDHLFRLAGHQAPPRGYRSDHPSQSLVRVLDRLDAPAQIVSDLGVTLQQNRLAQALRGVHTDRTGLERSMIYRWFTDRAERRPIPAEDHEVLSRSYTAHLRAVHSRKEDDWEVRELVDALHRRSGDFAELWDRHEVALITSQMKRICHPAVGLITMECQILASQNQMEYLVVYTAAAGSEDADRISFLSDVVIGATS